MIFSFTESATSQIYTLSLHDALPISPSTQRIPVQPRPSPLPSKSSLLWAGERRSEEHTSELQSHSDLVCRLLLEKKNNTIRAGAADAMQAVWTIPYVKP